MYPVSFILCRIIFFDCLYSFLFSSKNQHLYMVIIQITRQFNFKFIVPVRSYFDSDLYLCYVYGDVLPNYRLIYEITQFCAFQRFTLI